MQVTNYDLRNNRTVSVAMPIENFKRRQTA